MAISVYSPLVNVFSTCVFSPSSSKILPEPGQSLPLGKRSRSIMGLEFDFHVSEEAIFWTRDNLFLLYLPMKTVFLVVITPARRMGEIQALMVVPPLLYQLSRQRIIQGTASSSYLKWSHNSSKSSTTVLSQNFTLPSQRQNCPYPTTRGPCLPIYTGLNFPGSAYTCFVNQEKYNDISPKIA